MPRGVNKTILIGHAGQDPELKHLPSGSAVCSLSIATTESWKDKQSGEKQERTEWHRVVLFGRLAEITAEYARKGSQIYIEGRLQTRKWQGKDGQDRYTTEIVAGDMQLLGVRGSGGSSSAAPSSSSSTAPPSASGSAPPSVDPFDDSDIPF